MMIECKGNLLDDVPVITRPIWKVLPTNYSVSGKGFAVMGAGLAAQFVEKYGPVVKYELGLMIQSNPTIPRLLPLGVYGSAFWWALPTKHKPEHDSDLDLIRTGLWELGLYYQRQIVTPEIWMPRVGCGCGKLHWRHVKRVIQAELAKVGELTICHLSTRDTTQE